MEYGLVFSICLRGGELYIQDFTSSYEDTIDKILFKGVLSQHN